MIEAYELTLRQRDEQRQKQEEVEARDVELAQPVWKDVFSSCEELLQQEGQPLPRNKWGYLWPKRRGIVPHRPFRAFQYEKVWLLEKDVQIDGKTQEVIVFAISTGDSPKDASEIGIGIGKFSVVLNKYSQSGEISADLYQDYDDWYDEPARTSDANFFKEVIVKARQQTPATPVALISLGSRLPDPKR